MDDKLRIEHDFNVRGGLGMLIQPFHMTVCLTSSTIERIVFQAKLEGQFKEGQKKGQKKVGVQGKLDNLAELSEFKDILQDEVAKHKLVYLEAWRCVAKIYHEVSKHAHGNTEPILLERRYFTASELVVLISFFRLQEKWSSALEWELEWEVVWKKEV
jgi:hypothetical protein